MRDFDADKGRAARDAGIAAAGGKAYKLIYRRYFDMLRAEQPDFCGLPERFHQAMFELGLPEPRCPQALSGGFRGAIQRRLVYWIGERAQMEKVTSHARGDCKVYHMEDDLLL